MDASLEFRSCFNKMNKYITFSFSRAEEKKVGHLYLYMRRIDNTRVTTKMSILGLKLRLRMRPPGGHPSRSLRLRLRWSPRRWPSMPPGGRPSKFQHPAATWMAAPRVAWMAALWEAIRATAGGYGSDGRPGGASVAPA